MKRLSRLLFVLLFTAIAISSLLVSSYATEEDGYFDNIVLGVGEGEDERNITWYTTVGADGYVKYCKTGELVDGEMPSTAEVSYTTRKDAVNKPGYIINKATLKALLPDTEYTYQLFVGSYSSRTFSFKTDAQGAFDFVFVGDPQLSTASGSEKWVDTLDKIYSQFDPSLIVVAGDNISTPDSEEYYDYFFVDGMTGSAFAPTVGPGHDSPSVAFSEHFNIPNASSSYGVNETSANYWYTYNNTLFMHLNMSDVQASKNGEHKAFMEETIEANPGVNWKIVVLHNALFSAGMHSDPNYSYFASEIGMYREYLAPVLAECGIDLVLSGHDHIYVRSKFMNGAEVSSTIVDDGYVKDPVGTLHIAASSSTGTKFYENKVGDADYIAKLSDEKRKSAIHFSITETTLSLNSYYLDDMSVFDSFTVMKSEHIHTPTPIGYQAPGCEDYGNGAYYKCYGCGLSFKDLECEITTTKNEILLSPTGHSYAPATCTVPKTCQNEGCGDKLGKANGHDFKGADCENPITCLVCGSTRGNALGHLWDSECDADCGRDGCEHTRDDITHRDEDENSLCDICQAPLSTTESPDDNNSENNEKDSKGMIIIIIASACAVLVIASCSLIIIKSRKK